MTFRTISRTLLVAALLAPAVVSAKWSKTHESNLLIAGGPSEQTQGKLAPMADGGFYVVWFDNVNGGYDVRLQRLDVKGRPQWGANGILVADRDLKYTTDYGIAVDTAGNAMLAFHDMDAAGKVHIQVAKISPEGVPLWGVDAGVLQLPDGAIDGALSPKIVAMPDGGAVVAWNGRYTLSGQGNVVLQRLHSTGALLWGDDNLQINPPLGGSYLMSELRASEDGGAIVSMNAQLGRFVNQHWAQKYDADGLPLWGETPLKLWDDNATGAIPNGTFPTFVTDGAGGAVFCWDYTFGVSSRRARAQHVGADGIERYPHNGVAVSADDVNNRGECVASHDATTGDSYFLWRERTPGNNFVQSGVIAQRMDATGHRLWGETGNVILPLDAIEKSQVRMVPMPDGFVVAWALQSYPQAMPVQAAYITRDGGYGWSRGIIGIKSSASATGWLLGARSADGYAAFVWGDVFDVTDNDLVVQNIGRDGVLGKKDPGAIR